MSKYRDNIGHYLNRLYPKKLYNKQCYLLNQNAIISVRKQIYIPKLIQII